MSETLHNNPARPPPLAFGGARFCTHTLPPLPSHPLHLFHCKIFHGLHPHLTRSPPCGRGLLAPGYIVSQSGSVPPLRPLPLLAKISRPLLPLYFPPSFGFPCLRRPNCAAKSCNYGDSIRPFGIAQGSRAYKGQVDWMLSCSRLLYRRAGRGGEC